MRLERWIMWVIPDEQNKSIKALPTLARAALDYFLIDRYRYGSR